MDLISQFKIVSLWGRNQFNLLSFEWWDGEYNQTQTKVVILNFLFEYSRFTEETWELIDQRKQNEVQE